MSRPTPRRLVIDARPRGPAGPLAGERVLGRPVLAHLMELAGAAGVGPVRIHARADEHGRLRGLIADLPGAEFVPGPPPEGAAVLRADRLYDPARLRRALRRGRDPESAVLWRLDRPAGLAGAEAEWLRRTTYQPLGRFWALAPARALARALVPTRVRPNAVTAASATLVAGAAASVAFAPDGPAARVAAATALALALVLDTADGHLARLQGSASAFGRWLDAVLDELGDLLLHAAIAWSAYVRTGHPAWLLAGLLYAAGKHLFCVATTERRDDAAPAGAPKLSPPAGVPPLRRLVRALGHADVRWHLWIVLAAVGRLDAELVAYAAYYPARTLAGALAMREGAGDA